MITLQRTTNRCPCGHPAYVLEQDGESDGVVCLECRKGMPKASFDKNTGRWLTDWIDIPTMMTLRRLAIQATG